MEKVSNNRHQQLTAQHTTNDNQQREPITTTDSDTRQSTVSTRQPTLDNQQQVNTNTDRYTQKTKRTPANKQTDRQITDIMRKSDNFGILESSRCYRFRGNFRAIHLNLSGFLKNNYKIFLSFLT